VAVQHLEFEFVVCWRDLGRTHPIHLEEKSCGVCRLSLSYLLLFVLFKYNQESAMLLLKTVQMNGVSSKTFVQTGETGSSGWLASFGSRRSIRSWANWLTGVCNLFGWLRWLRLLRSFCRCGWSGCYWCRFWTGYCQCWLSCDSSQSLWLRRSWPTNRSSRGWVLRNEDSALERQLLW